MYLRLMRMEIVVTNLPKPRNQSILDQYRIKAVLGILPLRFRSPIPELRPRDILLWD